MAKLNYANRKSEGLKLAQIVAKDLRKKAYASPSKSDNSPIELHLEGKGIPDEGIADIAAALVEVLLKAHSEHRLNCQLGEVHLPNNHVSALGLRHLAPAINLAGPWLKDVDVSNNRITVHTSEDRSGWEEFLEAFRTCRRMRRLELSGNDFSGTQAFEILSRIYFRHPPYDPAAERTVSSEGSDSEDQPAAQLPTNLEYLTLDNRSSIGGYDEGCGLRYVPYLVFNNVKMDDAGCFLLSYIICRHVQPQHLLQPLKPGPIKQQLDTYDHQSGCSGIIYNTDHLSQYGVKLLEDCERQRAELVQVDIQEEESASSEQSSPPRDERPPTPPSAFATMLAPRHKYGTPRRRSSLVSGDSSKTSSAAAASRRCSSFDAESVRWKLQRETIENHGLRSVEIWHTAMRLLSIARAILPPRSNLLARNIRPATSTLLMTPRKMTPPTAVKQGRQDSAVSTHIVAEEVEGNVWRDERLPFNIPLKIWKRIMIQVVDPQNVLSDTQVGNVIAYAMDRATLGRERENVRNPESNQKWMVIDAMGCLAYEMPL